LTHYLLFYVTVLYAVCHCISFTQEYMKLSSHHSKCIERDEVMI